MYEGRAGADRLASVLHSYSQDSNVMKALSHYLNYNADQLKEDIEAMFQVTGDSITTTAVKGYVTSASIGLGQDRAKTELLLDSLDAAMENMSESEAEELYNQG